MNVPTSRNRARRLCTLGEEVARGEIEGRHDDQGELGPGRAGRCRGLQGLHAEREEPVEPAPREARAVGDRIPQQSLLEERGQLGLLGRH